MDRVAIEELIFHNKTFWCGYFLRGYGDFYNKELDISISDMYEEIAQEGDREYWHEFTGWYEGIFDESDGYLDEPTYLETYIKSIGKTIKIEFHPGDIYYFLDEDEVGCIGPHSIKLTPFSLNTMNSILDGDNGDVLFFLLFPMVKLEEEESVKARVLFKERLMSTGIFQEKLCGELVKIILG